MPTAGSVLHLIDTSTAIPLVLVDHAEHAATVAAIGDRTLGLAGDAAFEEFSVLTRQPAPTRRSTPAVARLLASNFPASRFLSPERAARLLADLERLGISGGPLYDALVAATAAEHGLPLVTRDQRPVAVYRALEVDVEILR